MSGADDTTPQLPLRRMERSTRNVKSMMEVESDSDDEGGDFYGTRNVSSERDRSWQSDSGSGKKSRTKKSGTQDSKDSKIVAPAIALDEGTIRACRIDSKTSEKEYFVNYGDNEADNKWVLASTLKSATVRDFEKREALGLWRWQFDDRKLGAAAPVWKTFEDDRGFAMNDSYKAFLAGKGPATFDFERTMSKKFSYTANFNDMTQKNLGTGRVRMIRRIGL